MDRHPTDHLYDVVVVGARCAGAATAMLLARQGLDVVVVDRADFPSDTLSTHAIARGGVVQLERWGLLDDVLATGAPPIRTVSFHFPGDEIVRRVKDRGGVDHLIAPRRHILDHLLIQAAEEAGASVQTGVSVIGTITDTHGRVTGVAVRERDGSTREIRGRFVVGADGIRSRIARAVGAAIIEERPPGGTCQYVYVAGLDADGFEFHVGERAFAGVFPTNDGEANVWACGPSESTELIAGHRSAALVDLIAQTSPSLAARIRAGSITSPVRGAAALPNHVRQAAGPGWALVGDAGYHRDPITGHGITDAFRDAELLAFHLGAVLRGDVTEAVGLASYAAERARALAPVFDLTWRLSQFPPVEEFVELQKELSTLIEIESVWLAERPPVPQPVRTAAA